MKPYQDLDLASEIGGGQHLGLDELADRFGVRLVTCYRWMTIGLPAAQGGRAHLAAIKRGRKWITTEAALHRFFAALPQIGGISGSPNVVPETESCPGANVNEGENRISKGTAA